MSFSENIKDEILNIEIKKRENTLAFIKGFASFTATVDDSKLSFLTDDEKIGKKISYMCKKQFEICDGKLEKAGVGRGGKCLNLKYQEKESAVILKALSSQNGTLDNEFYVDTECLSKDAELLRAYSMGAYIGGGFAAEPSKIYHLEFASKRERAMEELSYVLSLFGEIPKVVTREKYKVMYFKSFESIDNILNIIGAHKSMMALTNIKIEKEEKNDINRKVNFEVANMKKTNDASSKEISDIENIMYTVGLDALPDNLQEMALLRLANPEESLAQLAKLSGLSRSGVNHRLKKLSEIARELL